MSKVKYVNFEVVCPKSPWLKQKMQMRIFENKNGIIPCPCSGCEMMDASEQCEKCKATITIMFVENPQIEIISPIIPDFSLL